MYVVLRRGAIDSLARAGELAGAAAVACVRAFAEDPRLEAWRERPRKVCLRARNPAQWRDVLAEPHALAGDPEGESVAAFAPRPRAGPGPPFARLPGMRRGARAPPPP